MGVAMLDFLSEKLGYHTKIYVILPGCVQRGEEPDGTLCLLHGGGGNGQDWLRFSSIERYAEERNFAVVLPEVDGSCFYADMKYGYPYFQYLTKEVLQVTEKLFPINREAEKRYVAGFSMGGYGAYKWAFNEPERFRCAANLSGLSFITKILDPGKGLNHHSEEEKGCVVALCYGSLEELAGSDSDSEAWILRASESGKYPKLFAAMGTEDFSYRYAQEYLDFCREKGVWVHYEEMPGGHEWKVWDSMIVRFLDWIKETE